MTIESLYEPDIYQGNDTADTFAIGFKYTSTAHVKATEIDDATGAKTELVLNTDFTLSGDGSATAGSLTLTAGALATGKTLVIELDIPALQATNFGNQGGFFPENHTAAFDKVTQILQIHDEKIARSVKTAIVGNQTADELRDTLVASAAAAEASAAAAGSAKTDAEAAQTAAEEAQAAAEAAASTMTLASQAEAEAGTDNTKYLSSLRTDQAIQARKVRSGAGTIASNELDIDASLLDVVNVTADDDFTLNIPSNGQAGQRVSVRVTQDGTGSRILTLHANFLIASELVDDGVVLSTAAGAIDKIGLYCVDGTVWEVEAFGTDYAVAA